MSIKESLPLGLSVGTYHDKIARPQVSIMSYKQDVIVQRRLVNHQVKSGCKGGGVRRPITAYSKQSQARLKHLLRNIEQQKYLLTLTYPALPPQDGKTIKKHLSAFTRWLKMQGVTQGIWILEFQERGAPHFHLLFDVRLDVTYCAQKWSHIIGNSASPNIQSGIQLEDIRHWHKTVSYLTKAKSKEVPEGFDSTGRLWGVWGGLKPQPTFVITNQDQAVRAARYLRKAQESKANRGYQASRRKKRDNGFYKRTHYGAGKSAAKNLPRLLALDLKEG
jgi:hypothetical protein